MRCDAVAACVAQEKLPGGYDGDANSPLGSPTAAGTDRYAGAEGAAFGDVEEDEGASGNPGVADLQQGSKGDGQVLIYTLVCSIRDISFPHTATLVACGHPYMHVL